MEERQTDTTQQAPPQKDRPSESALMAVFLRQRGRLRRIAAGMGLSGDDLDDVLQEVSIRVIKHAPQIQQEDRMIGWLVKTTVNQCLTEHRRRFRRRPAEIVRRRPELAHAPFDNAEPARRAGQAEKIEAIRRTLADLDPSLLLVAVLRYFCDLNSSEIGDLLELKAATVRSRLREARMVLAGRLRERGIDR